MATEITGQVYGVDKHRKTVSIQFGLTPKVVRFVTDEQWEQDEEVVVTVTRKSGTPIYLNLPTLKPEG